MCCDKNSSQIYSAKVVPLKDLLLDSNKYEIPKYQRPYAWEEKHWDDLWNDLQRAYSKKSEYLLGSVYLNENGEILDGQQRFTTLYIFLKCFGFKKNELCDIELGGNDKEFFEKIKNDKNISDDEIKTASQRKLKGCCNFFKGMVEKVQKKEIRNLILDEFKDFIENQVFFIKTTIKDKDKTNSIITFITQTDRGKRLSNLEKIKSNLYYAAYTLFNDNEELEKIQDNIQDVFGECYKHINTLYDKPEKGERMIISALYGLLRYMNIKSAKDKFFKDIEITIVETQIYKEYILKDIYLLESEDTITTRINNALSVSKDNKFLYIVLKLLEKIEDFLGNYSQTKDENEIFHNELYLNRYILVAMILGEYSIKKHNSENTNLQEPSDEELKNKNIDINQWKSNTTNFNNIEQKIELNSLGKCYNKRLIERSHFSVFSAGKSPYSTFLQNPIDTTNNYKKKYLYIFDSISWGNYRYILLAYEEFYRVKKNLAKLDYKTVLIDKPEREHLFAQTPQDNVKTQIKNYLNTKTNKEDYAVWIQQIGNILLLSESDNILVKNKSPLKKAEILVEKYQNNKDYPFQTTLKFLEKIQDKSIEDIAKLCEKRTEELKCFVWHRF